MLPTLYGTQTERRLNFRDEIEQECRRSYQPNFLLVAISLFICFRNFKTFSILFDDTNTHTHTY